VFANGLAELAGDLVDRTLRLHQQVDDLGAAAVAERPRHIGETVGQRILSCPVAHPCTSHAVLFKKLLDKIRTCPQLFK
jgi:hypothetical protein